MDVPRRNREARARPESGVVYNEDSHSTDFYKGRESFRVTVNIESDHTGIQFLTFESVPVPSLGYPQQPPTTPTL